MSARDLKPGDYSRDIEAKYRAYITASPCKHLRVIETRAKRFRAAWERAKATGRKYSDCLRDRAPRNAQQVRAANAAISDPLRLKWKLFRRFIGRQIRAEYARLVVGEKR